MADETGGYALTSYITKLWQTNNDAALQDVFIFIQSEQKPNWCKRVIFKHSRIPEDELHEMAEDAFVTAWNSFDKNGRLGKISIQEPSYLGYLYRSFKNNFLKILEKRQRELSAEKNFEYEAFQNPEIYGKLENINFFSPKTARVLNSMTKEAREMLLWRHAYEKTYDEIAAIKGINRESVIKLTSRYKQQFLAFWNNI